MISIDLSGKTILITGALGAIAEHMVRKLVASGATLVLTDIKAEEQAKRTLHDWQIPPSSYKYLAADITDSGQVDGVVNAAFDHLPDMDTVIGHAADASCILSLAHRKPTLNASSASTISHRLIWLGPRSRNGSSAILAGHLIFTSSYVARMPHSQISSYASAKAALENFARSLALEYAFAGIRVNVVSPGNVAAGSSLKVFEEDPAYREFCDASFTGEEKQSGFGRGRLCVSLLAAG
ncbi:MAG: hypothetical protein JWO71_3429 [Candidatus Acidoferrum typicum]|nr:hypothetical protein [Candidatus Acidoferrum typicum]